MQITRKNLTDTKVKLIITATTDDLQPFKKEALQSLASGVKVAGFREGKAPLNIIEKQLEPARLQSTFLDIAIEHLYGQAVRQEDIRPVSQPEVKLTKFVPFDSIEVDVEVDIIGAVKLPDYKKIKQAKEKITVAAKDIDGVIADLLTRDAERTDVDRAAKNGDQVVIDFKGVDAKTKEPIQGADGKAYPLVIGSNSFIPGFEPEMVGLKAGETKTFTVTFPKDYGAVTLQNRKVEFTVSIQKVQAVTEPKLDDAFAAKVGPFKTVAELKEDIKKELTARKTADSNLKYADDLVVSIAEKSKLSIPESLVVDQIERLEHDQRQNLTYRGLTWQEYLSAEGLTDESYRDKIKPEAEKRVRVALVLAEIAEIEKITVTPQEIENQIAALKTQYPDQQMQAELNKSEARRSITSRLLTQKTVDKLVEYSSN